MTEGMRFLRKGVLFVSPLLMWVTAIVVIDPFNYFRVVSAVPEKGKIENAASLNSLVFNMLKAKHEPHENLVIGDSRAEALPINYIPGEPYYRLVANALKLNESIDLFYFANRCKPLKRVLFTINFNQFNQYAFADRVHSVEDMIHNPLLYIFDRNVGQAAYHVVRATMTHERSFSSIPPMNQDEFWRYMVVVRGSEHYKRYRYPVALYDRLKEMLAFAKTNGIEVTFVIVPHHADFQSRVREFGLLDEYLQFKRDMSRLEARVIDFDYMNAITTERGNFKDPIHYNNEIGRLIIDEVFRGPLQVGKLLDGSWANQCAQFVF
jgi:hypothetical protein